MALSLSHGNTRMYMEHRWGHRHEISKPVQLGTGNGIAAPGRICNVSMSGAFVISPLPVSLFSYVQVQFTALLNGKRTSTSAEGQVVRKDATGFGIEWREFAPVVVRDWIGQLPSSHTDAPHTSAGWEVIRHPQARFHP